MTSQTSQPAPRKAPATGQALTPEQIARRAVMAICAEASADELAVALQTIGPVPDTHDLRAADGGLVMLRGRMGGDGRPFNLGEASMTRAAIALSDGRQGFAFQLGRDKAKARMAAILDALAQGAEYDAVIKALEPIKRRLDALADRCARETAATRVNFFTMVRGED